MAAVQEQNPSTIPAPVQKVAEAVKGIPKKGKFPAAFLGIGLVVALLGVGTGWLLAGRPSGTGDSSTSGTVKKEGEEVTEAGLADESTFRDEAEGELKEGGIEGEGTHHLDRGLGAIKYVYLTSTVIDLQGFVGKNVKIWGETISAQKAGWLMDVGKIKVIK